MRYLRKFFSLQAYQHLNTSDYLQVKTECDLYKFCKNLKTSRENLEDKEILSDGSQFAAQETSNDEKRWINEAGINIQNFFKMFCLKPSDWREPSKRGKDKSDRAKYNRQMGLVLSSQAKQSHALKNIELDGKHSNVKTIRQSISSLHNVASYILEEEKSDDIEDEIQTEELIWNQSKPCELNNPIASLINSQRLLPHIALNNQLLRPRAFKREIQKVLFIVTRTAEILSEGVLLLRTDHVKECLHWLILILTGRVINKVETEPFFLNEKNIFIDHENAFIRMGFPQYKHRDSLSNKDVYITSEIEELELTLPSEVKVLLSSLLVYLKNKQANKSHIQINTKNKNSAFSDWNISETRLQIQRSYAEISSDSWLLSVISWQSSGLSSTQKHYASYTVQKVQSLFEKHIQTFLNIDCKTIKWSNRTNARIGSPYYLNAKTYRQIIKQLWQNANPLFDQLNYQSIKLNELRFRFNSLAFWIDSYCSFAAATRNITDPLIQYDLVSHEGLYRVNDKNKYDGFNTRIVFVPAALLAKLKAYKKVRQKLLIYLKKTHGLSTNEEAIVKSNHLFFFKQPCQGKLKIVEYTRSRCRDEIYWQANTDNEVGTGKEELLVYENLRALKTNVNRHYLRGRLLDLGMPGFFIDAFMGHWHAGTQPWGQMSIFNQSHYLEQLKKLVPKILKELAFNANEIKS
jgi:hypothetical protein